MHKIPFLRKPIYFDLCSHLEVSVVPPECIDVPVDSSAEDAGTLVSAVNMLLVDPEQGHGFAANVAEILHDLSLVHLPTVPIRLLSKKKQKDK